MTQEEVERRLRLPDVDHGELATLLMFEFGGCWTTDEKTVAYPDAEPGALQVEYSGSKIRRILPRPGLTDETVLKLQRRIEAELLTPPVRKVARFVLYSRRRAHGYWTHDDHLVLRQPAPGTPQAHEWSEIHPLLCEVAYQGATEDMTDTHRKDRAVRHTKLLLTLLVPDLTDRTESSVSAAWAWVLPPGLERESVCMQQIYRVKEFEAIGNELTEQADLPAMPALDRLYELKPWESRQEVLVLPTTLGADIDRFHALAPSSRREFLRAAFWHHQARLLHRHSLSASYQALIQSIEVLAAATPTTDGARQQFKTFLRDYVPGGWGGADELYRLRSRIVHGNTLMLADEEGSGFHLHPRDSDERHRHMLAEAVSRAGAINWLRGLKASSSNPAQRP